MSLGFENGIHVGFTGTQQGCTEWQLATIKKVLSYGKTLDVVSHHGDCIGADEEFHDICVKNKYKIEVHPPLKKNKRAYCVTPLGYFFIHIQKDYLDRNKDIVMASQVMIVCPKEQEEQLRSGTWSTYRFAMKMNKPTIIIYPNSYYEKLNFGSLA